MSNQQQPLLTPYRLGDLPLRNRIVMAPMTRARASNAELAPTPLMATYYAQRASAGLIIAEGTGISPRSFGFINTPGIFSDAQIEGWKRVTEAVHEQDGKIFLQIAHVGAASHPDFQNGEIPKGPSAVNPQLQSYTVDGFKDSVTPEALTKEEISEIIKEFGQAARNAKLAGFDGVEIHAQIYTLIPQFLSIAMNQRTDEYGGSIENRSRILFEILEEVKEVYPAGRIGFKFSPTVFNPGIIQPDAYTVATYDYIFDKLNAYQLSYIHLVGPAVNLEGTAVASLQENYFEHFRKIYRGVLIANLGFTWETGNKIILDGTADMVSFGAAFVANPDLVKRFTNNIPLAVADMNTYYAGGEKGYADYPEATM